MHTDQLNCPQCGGALPLTFSFAKLTVCEQCDSTIFLEDDGAKLAGKRSVLAQRPSLIQLKQPFSYRHTQYIPVGYIRYNYGYGYWDEWWVLDNAGQGVWMSVDEGDFAFEYPETLDGNIPALSQLQTGKTAQLLGQEWRVTERGHASCEGFRGELPEIIEDGETFDYAHLSGPNKALITLEYFDENEVYAYRGKWVDPFEITVEATGFNA